MNILVKFQPDIPILMVMGGRLTHYYGPKIGDPVRSKQLKRGKNYDAQLQTPLNTEIIMVNPQQKLYGLKH
jgi:hypothetical protein